MLFPLGLGLKLRNNPWVTYLIILLCTAVYFGGQKRALDKGSKDLVEVLKEKEKNVSSKDLYYQYCLKYAKNPSFSCTAPEGPKIKAEDEKLKEPVKPEPDFKGITSILDDTKLLIDFRNDVEAKSSKVTSLPAYADYLENAEPFDLKMQKIYKDNNWLAKNNFTLASIIWAAFSHGSLMHLIGNMFALFVFGRYVEATVGKIFYLLSYLIFGTGGLAAYAWFDLNGSFVLGASANVFAVMGMFYVLFFHFKMKVYIWQWFIVSHKVTVNVKYYFPLFFLGQEIVLSFSNAATGVAHRAHFYGLIFGCLIAYIWKRLNPMPRDFLYKDEYEFWNKIKDTVSTKEFIVEANKILKYNPYNQEVKTYMLKRLLSKDDDLENIHAYRYLKHLLPYYLIDHIGDKKNYDVIYQTLDLVPFEVSYLRYFQLVGQKHILIFLDHAIDNKKLVHAMKLIQLFFEKYRGSRKLKNLEKTLFSIFDYLQQQGEFETQISSMYEYTVSRRFRKAITKYRNLKGVESANG